MGMLGDTHPSYNFYQCFSDPGDFGFSATARRRTWVIGSHDSYSTCFYDPWELQDLIKDQFHERNIETRVKDYLVASKLEIIREATERYPSAQLSTTSSQPDLTSLLTAREFNTKLRWDQEYRRRFGKEPDSDPDLVYFLGDSADWGPVWSATSGKIPTYRLNSKRSKYWLPSLKRWLTQKERLVSMGFPCVPELADGLDLPLVGATDIKRAADVCGNSMHFQSSGIWQMIALVCFGPSR